MGTQIVVCHVRGPRGHWLYRLARTGLLLRVCLREAEPAQQPKQLFPRPLTGLVFALFLYSPFHGLDGELS